MWALQDDGDDDLMTFHMTGRSRFHIRDRASRIVCGQDLFIRSKLYRPRIVFLQPTINKNDY